MKIFLSHASEDKSAAESIAFSLRSRGHKVFLDRDDLPPGQSYDQQIERAVKESDILIFLVSPSSVTSGRYTLTELAFARRKWQNPNGRILPVIARKTPFDEIPSYLKAVTLLEPLGNITAETCAAVDDLGRDSHAKGILRFAGADAIAGPLDILRRLEKANKPAFRLLLAGVGVLAAAVLVARWKNTVDVQTIGLIGAYVVGFAALLTVFTVIFQDPSQKKALSWFATIIFIVWSVSVFISALLPGKTPFAPTPCLVWFWEDCGKTTGNIAAKLLKTVTLTRPDGEPISINVDEFIRTFPWFEPRNNKDVSEVLLDSGSIYVTEPAFDVANLVKAGGVVIIRLTRPNDGPVWINPRQIIDMTGEIFSPTLKITRIRFRSTSQGVKEDRETILKLIKESGG